MIVIKIIAGLYYLLVLLKVLGRLWTLRFRVNGFMNEKMSFHLGVFIALHAVALILYGFATGMKALMTATL